MFTTATATMPLTRPGPRVAMMATASRKYGKAMRVSMDRMMSLSTQRPTKPARRPNSEPASAASAVAARPTTSEMRAPKRRRLKRSRPNSSVPRRWPPVKMGASRRAVSMASGSRGASQGATTASTAITTTRARPKRAAALRRNTRTTSVIADARVEYRVEQVDHEVDEHEGGGDEQHAALHQRIVAGLDGAHHHGAEPRPGEHRLREDGPTEEEAHLHAEHGDDGIHGVLEHVTRDHRALGQALGPRRAHVVLADDLEHARSREPRQRSRGGGAKSDGGEHEMPQHIGHPAAVGRAHAARGKPAELQREHDDQHDARPEHGQAHARDGHAHAHAIEPGILLHRGEDARDQAEEHRDGQRPRGEEQRGLEAQQHLGQDGAPEGNGATEIAARHLPDPVQVLDDQRLIETEVAAQALHVLLGRLGAEHDGSRISGSQVQYGEDQHRDPEQDGNGEQESSEGVGGKPAAPYCSHTCESTRSKFGWSLKPCTRFR